MESKATKNFKLSDQKGRRTAENVSLSSSEDNSKHKMSRLFETAAENIAGIYKHYTAQESTHCPETAIIVLWTPWLISVLEQKRKNKSLAELTQFSKLTEVFGVSKIIPIWCAVSVRF